MILSSIILSTTNIFLLTFYGRCGIVVSEGGNAVETINDRIAYLIKTLDMTKTKFAERIHVGQPFVSMICKGDAAPSDRTISDICREFSVSEPWLREGVGEPFVQRTRNQELAIWFNTVLADADDSIRKRMIAALSVLTTEEWEIVEKFAKKLTEGR